MGGHAQAAYEAMLHQHRPPIPEDVCHFCSLLGRPATPLGLQTPRYRCSDCFRMPHFCPECVVLVHHLSPFHRILRWDTRRLFWDKVTSADLGMRIHYGHNGRPCPAKRKDRQYREMVVVHEHGLMKIPIALCSCQPTRAPTQGTTPAQEADEGPEGQDNPLSMRADQGNANGRADSSDEPYQLIDLGMFPGSWDTPRTVFTENVLREFHLLTLQAHVTAHDFFIYLRRMTDNIAPHMVPVSCGPLVWSLLLTTRQDRYRQLNQSMREYTYLRACRRHGQRPSWNLPLGSLAVDCPACPHTGVNMREGWEDRDEEYAYVRCVLENTS